MEYFLGIDLGSSSVKVSIIDGESGHIIAKSFAPQTEAPILSVQNGWAEQHPDDWWAYLKTALRQAMVSGNIKAEDIKAVGITYQMHGLVLVDKDLRVLRPSIIWCDSRAVPYGEKAFEELGHDYCLTHLLNSPGNFTAAKLAWVRENEPDIFSHIYKYMLPGDYLAMRMTGEVKTTVPGLSEGMSWDFADNRVSDRLLSFFGIPSEMVADTVPTFGEQGLLSASAATELGLRAGTPICYRSGDQPNNAFSLNVLNPGEVAATAGTSGVVYGITDKVRTDPRSRINMFAHVNHTASEPRIGVMHCTNGVGILNAWMKRMVAPQVSYEQFNDMAAQVPVGSDGVVVLPFGNGAERILENRQLGSVIHGINFNNHNANTLARAAQEGVAFSFKYGMDIMQATGMDTKVIRAGHANMFLSPIFRTTLATVADAEIELYDTDGSVGAATGAALGCGYYTTPEEAFRPLHKIKMVTPDRSHQDAYLEAYARWEEVLQRELNA
ncbi:MAG: carbohydrate kinase [Bacteroidales bacterium]|nr:carbohydrate kinase [Bacteroidales bacterium]